MKHFYYTLKDGKYSRNSGSTTVHIKCYQLMTCRKKYENPMKFIGEGTYQTASCKGSDGEAMTILYKNRAISEESWDFDHGYYRRDNGKFLLHQIGF